MTESISVREARLDDRGDVQTLFEILDAYARGPGGQSKPLSKAAEENLGPGLRGNSNAFVLFGSLGQRVVGAAVCVWSYSTFGGGPSVNLHDFSVYPEAQGLGVGTRLLEELERRARERGCCKMTLEVNESNQSAKRLYARYGFEGWPRETLFVTKPLR